MGLSKYIDYFSKIRHLTTSEPSNLHKTCLLLAVMELVVEETINQNRIVPNDALIVRFNQIFAKTAKANDKSDVNQPFFYLQSSGFWHHQVFKSQLYEYQQQIVSKQRNQDGINKVQNLIQYAYVDAELFEYFKSATAREALRHALLNKPNEQQTQAILVPKNGWSWFECEQIVNDYFEMLAQEIKGEGYNKAQHNRDLVKALNESRTRGSIEKKHQNISAILNEMGMPIIDGYKPLSNYQRNILPDVVGATLANNQNIQQLITTINQQTVEVPRVEDILQRLEGKPTSKPVKENQQNQTQGIYNLGYKPQKRDYLAQEAANHSLGLKGEEFVINYEKARLIYEGQENLADKIEHVSLSDDALGYDIHSYNETGQDRFIEVKTTNYDRYTRFYISPNELKTSKNLENQYHLYRVFNFKHDPKLFISQGRLDSGYNLTPSAYLANIK